MATELGISFFDDATGDTDDWLSVLDNRQRALLTAGLNYHALVNRGRQLRIAVYLHSACEMALADDFIDPMLIEGSRLLGFKEINAAGGSAHATVAERAVVLPDADSVKPVDITPTLLSRVLRRLERAAPVAMDGLRQRRNTRSRRASDRFAPDRGRRQSLPAESDSAIPVTGVPAVLVGMYWLSGGGAETWALDCVAGIRNAGLHPVVVTDVRSAHELAAHPALKDATILILDRSDHPRSGDLVRGIVEHFALRGVMIHHSNWMYAQLPLLRSLDPDLWIVDSVHTIEWGNGGFPMVAAFSDAQVDEHHVISADLENYLTGIEGVDPSKIVVAPLLSLGLRSGRSAAVRPVGDIVILGFVGRLSQQKRPLLFLALLARLDRSGRAGRYRAIIHGHGPLEGEVRLMARRLGVDHLIEYRRPPISTEETYRDIDVLVITSQIEGLTLTSMEATAAGVPVLSANVGAQRAIVSDDMLASRMPRTFLRQARRAIVALVSDQRLRDRVVAEQARKLSTLAKQEDATEWLTRTLAMWAR